MLKRTVTLSAMLLALVATAHAESNYDKPGFYTKMEDGRLWVFQEGSKELADEQKNGLPEKASIRIGAGPDGVTIKAPNDATIDAYLNGVAPAAPATSAQ